MSLGSDPAPADSQILTIELLGPPQVRRADAALFRPRGNKVWGILAFLVLTDGPVSRQLLASMLFSEAKDPFGALRWNISQLRRLLGNGASVAGDPVELRLPPGILLDTDVLLKGSWMQAVRVSGLGRDILEGLEFNSEPGFDLWLTSERARLRAAAEAILHEATLATLARGRSGLALEYATRLVSLNPYDENTHVLLARALVDAGRIEEARRHVDKTIGMFRAELGIAPSPSFRLAALSHRATPVASASPSSVTAQLETGESAINAGAWITGIERLRGATDTAEALGDDRLVAQANLSLGSALVHAARGFDEEGAKALHRAGAIASKTGHDELAAQARRELAYIELLRGRYERAFSWLDKAGALADKQDPEAAWIAAVRGASESDVAHYTAASGWLDMAVTRSEAAGDEAARAFAHAFQGRLALLLMDLETAADHLKQSIELARSSGWTAFVPFPMSLQAEVTLLSGQIDSADETLDHAYALSCQLGDPCWESLGARGLGLVAAERDDYQSALAQLDEAPRLCRRFPDSYLWVEAYALEALCRVLVKVGAPVAPGVIAELETMASRTGMRELLVRAMLHRAAIGEHEALDVAKALASSISNPALHAAVDATCT